MTGKEILGIYAGKNSTLYYCVKKGIFGFKAISSEHGSFFSGQVEYGADEGVREVLKRIRFNPKRKIFLALPRSVFFAREVKLPVMPVEDAIESVKNSISMYSHLPHKEIYYDIAVTPSFKDDTRCLFIYAEKKKIDRYRKIFRETGYLDSLVYIFPISYGVCAHLKHHNNISYPAGILLDYEKICEFSVFDDTYWLSSITWDSSDKINGKIAFKVLAGQFPEISDNFYRIKACSGMEDKNNLQIDNLQDSCFDSAKLIDDLNTNLAIAAVAPALCKIQKISIDEKPVKVKFIKPLRYIVLISCIITALLFYITDNISKNIKAQEIQRDKLKIQVMQLKKKIKPVQERVRILNKAADVKEDAELFLKLRPRLYTCINEIARLVPEDTWFSGFRFYKGVIHLNGYSKDALLTVKNLRKSKYFSKVSLKGSVVSKSNNGKEQFNLELTLNKEENHD